MEFLIALAILVAVAAFVAVPLRRSRGGEGPRDAEADRAAGKLSEPDFERLDRELRGEAIEVLKRLDRLREEGPGRASSASSEPG